MKETHQLLYPSLFLSLLLHLSVFYTALWNNHFFKLRNHQPETRVAVQVIKQPTEKPIKKVALDVPEPPPAIKPLPLPVEKPKVKKAVKPKKVKKAVARPSPEPNAGKASEKTSLPVSNTSNAAPPDAKDIKPVFGMNRESLSKSGESGMSVRVGNTLVREQEEDYTPPEKVKSYTVTPPFELSSPPVYKTRVEPEYPPSLKNKAVEGNVLLTATIDDNGKVVDVKVKHSANDLFTQAAISALKQFTFTPGKQNGRPVTTTIDIPITFILDK